MFDLLIRNVDVLHTTPAIRIAARQDIAIEGKRIATIAPAGTLDPNNARDVIDGQGMIAAPGLINCHAHTAMVLFRGVAEDVAIESWFNDYIWAVERNLTADDVYWGTLLGIAEMIESGVTTVADHYFHMDRVAEAAEQSGIRANLVTALFGNGDSAQAEFDGAARFIERWQGAADGRITAWLGPHSPYLCPAPFLKQVAQRARSLGVGIHIHVSETAAQVAQSISATRQTPIDVLRDSGLLDVPAILAHAAHPTESDIGIIAQYGAGVAHCPKTFLKLAAGIAPIMTMHDAGVAVGFGSDGAASNNTLDILEQARLAALLQKHDRHDATRATVSEILQMAFAGGARVLHLPDLGDLMPGKLADLILIRQDGAHMQPTAKLDFAHG